MIVNGWKEIAKHLGRGVRTVQRWEGLGLPVHRPKGVMRSAVFSRTRELDAWVNQAHIHLFEAIADLKAENSALRTKVALLEAQIQASEAAHPKRKPLARKSASN